MSLSISSGFNSSQIASNLFSKIDSKQQGYIDKSELQQAFTEISGSSDSSSTDALFSKLDGDGDGKITQNELSIGLDALAESLLSQLQQSQMSGMGLMPPPPGAGDDEGLSKDQLSSIANDASTDDSAKAKLTSLVQNFDAADSNQDGKVSAQEAMAFDQSQTGETGSTGASATDGSIEVQAQLMAQLMQLIQSYGGSDSNDTHGSTVSVTA